MTKETHTPWKPGSWRAFPARQQPAYADPALVDEVTEELCRKPPLVSLGEVDRLHAALAETAEGKRFMLQGGDCAECFSDCTEVALVSKLKVLLQMSLVLTYATRKPVVRVGRLAGQYAKPRSREMETVNGKPIPVYRGDLINDRVPDEAARQPDPMRMLKGYHYAAASLNFVRALIEGGFADLHHPEQWDLSFIEASPHRHAYQQAVDSILDSIKFMETIGAASAGDVLRRVDFYTAHEALLLPYEEALTRQANECDYYNLGAHFLWVGYRTADAGSAHVEYLSGLRNPVGLKVGPTFKAQDLQDMIARLDARREPGHLTLITRFGEQHVAEHLPRAIQAVQKSGHNVVWSCDPMHGNTEPTDSGLKTRRMDAIFAELEQTFSIHEQMGTCLGGVHFELTGEPVTECIGAFGDVKEEDLSRCYETACDPRLNGVQSLEMAFLIARLLR